MLAINHVTLATALTFGASLYLNQSFFLPFIIFVVFAALLPDVDHPNSEISNFFPVLNKIFPHRGVTHSAVGAGVITAGLYLLLGYNRILSIILIIAALIGVYYARKVLDKRMNQILRRAGGVFSRRRIRTMINLATGVLMVFLVATIFLVWKERFRVEILALLIFGYLAHLVGDWVTIEGIPLFWPIRKKTGLRLFRTGSEVESFIGIILVLVNVYLIYRFWGQFDLSGSAYWNNYLDISELGGLLKLG